MAAKLDSTGASPQATARFGYGAERGCLRSKVVRPNGLAQGATPKRGLGHLASDLCSWASARRELAGLGAGSENRRAAKKRKTGAWERRLTMSSSRVVKIGDPREWKVV